LNRISLYWFRYFDTGKGTVESEPERFYHGFVLGLLTELRDRYWLWSNWESGFGRYDVILEPFDQSKNVYLLEFKVKGTREASLEETVQSAL
jgi:hypothetical protein